MNASIKCLYNKWDNFCKHFYGLYISGCRYFINQLKAATEFSSWCCFLQICITFIVGLVNLTCCTLFTCAVSDTALLRLWVSVTGSNRSAPVWTGEHGNNLHEALLCLHSASCLCEEAREELRVICVSQWVGTHSTYKTQHKLCSKVPSITRRDEAKQSNIFRVEL